MKDPLCPWFKKPCLEHGCAMYGHLLGKNPQTGQDTDEWGCTFVFLPRLLVENSQQQRHTSAAVESFRNEVARGNERMLGLAQQKLLQERH